MHEDGIEYAVLSRTLPLSTGKKPCANEGPDGFEMSDDEPPQSRAAQLLLEAGVGIPAGDIPVLLLPLPVVYLLFRGEWSQLLLLTSWHPALHLHTTKSKQCRGPIDGWPLAGADVWNHAGKHEDLEAEPVDPLTPEALSDMCDALRRWGRTHSRVR